MPSSDEQRLANIRESQQRVVQPDSQIVFLLDRLAAAEARIAALVEAVIVPANGNDWQCVYCLIWAATKEAIAHEPECVIRALNPE